jgi:putative transposase
MPVVREQHKISTQETCRVLGLPRAKQYREPVARVKEKQKLIIEIEAVINELPGYGYRRVTKELQRRNYHVNHKKILSIMRVEKLLCKRGKPRKTKTTDSNHSNQIYPNLIKKISPERLNQ